MVSEQMKNRFEKFLTRLLMLGVGAAIYGFGVALFLDPYGIAPGGLTGIAVIINKFAHIDTGLMVLVMNIPLMIAGLIKFGKEFLVSTIWATVVSSLSMSSGASLLQWNIIKNSLLTSSGYLTDSMLLSSLFGGAMLGVGMGIVFRYGGTTGGTDIIVKFLRQKYRHLNSGILIVALDAIVLVVSMFAFKQTEIGLYIGVTIFTNSFVFNKVLYGTDEARLVYIVSDDPEKIAKRLLGDLEIGVTYVEGQGGYTNKEKKVIMCASKNKIFPFVKQIVREEDPQAFMIVSSAKEIYGEGFKLNSNVEM